MLSGNRGLKKLVFPNSEHYSLNYLKHSTMSKRVFSFSMKIALGISSLKQLIACQTGIPTTPSGLERKVGRNVIILY
jgi:hypothetical protein